MAFTPRDRNGKAYPAPKDPIRERFMRGGNVNRLLLDARERLRTQRARRMNSRTDPAWHGAMDKGIARTEALITELEIAVAAAAKAKEDYHARIYGS